MARMRYDTAERTHQAWMSLLMKNIVRVNEESQDAEYSTSALEPEEEIDRNLKYVSQEIDKWEHRVKYTF